MTVIHMRTAALPLHKMLGSALSSRERAFQTATRAALQDQNLPVREIFSKGAVPQSIPEVLPDDSRAVTSYILLTLGVEIDADPDAVERALADLTIPGFPATAWKFEGE
ncbi:hypothetical protein [Rhodococcus pyridinivorans]|uniref:hypothetical protein n=1 Tax=Rhodococcus pyridinivorans TaxID=103816 RepID=UPI00265941BF|nr:hypothetical protein [Rhodococcus pyridinivorans]